MTTPKSPDAFTPKSPDGLSPKSSDGLSPKSPDGLSPKSPGASTPESPELRLPHHGLVGYQLALGLVKLIARTRISDAQLRQQARRSAASCALNAAEGAARQSLADKSRAFGIALCEGCEACAAVEIAGALGACSASDVRAVLALGVRVKNVLSRLVR